MPAPPDADGLAAVMTRVAGGDQGAFAEFYDATAAMVFGLVLRVLRDRAQAEEVTQEVYVQAWRTASGFDAGKGSVRAWLNTIAHRQAVDRVRSVARSVRRERDDHARSGVSASGDPSETVIADEERTWVRSALAELPEPQRVALALAYFDGRTQTQIAEDLGVPLGTVKTRVRDGMRRLRQRRGEVS